MPPASLAATCSGGSRRARSPRADRAEVEDDDVADPMLGQQAVDLAQLGQGPLRTLVAHETPGRIEDLEPAPQRREAQQQLMLGGAQGRVLEKSLEAHEVACP